MSNIISTICTIYIKYIVTTTGHLCVSCVTYTYSTEPMIHLKYICIDKGRASSYLCHVYNTQSTYDEPAHNYPKDPNIPFYKHLGKQWLSGPYSSLQATLYTYCAGSTIHLKCIYTEMIGCLQTSYHL